MIDKTDKKKKKNTNGNISKRIVLGLVESEAFNSHYKKNPYNFKLLDMTSMNVTIDGEQVPLKPINSKLHPQVVVISLRFTHAVPWNRDDESW